MKAIERLIKIALDEVGYCEKETNSQLDNPTANAGDENYTKYWRDLAAAGYYQASKQGFDWCDGWNDWCFLQLCGSKELAEKVTCQTGPYGAGCEWSARYYKAQGRLDRNFRSGDQIFFKDYAHTGIIVKVADGRVYTVEGNTHNKVMQHDYDINSDYLLCCGHPIYELVPDTEDPAPAPIPQPQKPEKPEKMAIAAGDLVQILPGATYYNGGGVPGWVQKLHWIVEEVSGDRAVIDKDDEGLHSICSPISTKYLQKIGSKPEEKPLSVGDKVRIDHNAPVYGTNYRFSGWCYDATMYIREISGDRVVISTQRTGAVTGAVHMRYLSRA